jgi:hypothetical protein
LDSHRQEVNNPAEWETRLRVALQDRAEPVFTSGTTTIPAASVWIGSRQWARAFRKAGLTQNDVVGIRLPAGPAFVQVLVAALSNGYQVCVGDDVTSARLVVTEEMVNGVSGPAGVLSVNNGVGTAVTAVREIVADADLFGGVVIAHGHWNTAKAVERLALVPIVSGAAHVVISTLDDVSVLTELHRPDRIEAA